MKYKHILGDRKWSGLTTAHWGEEEEIPIVEPFRRDKHDKPILNQMPGAKGERLCATCGIRKVSGKRIKYCSAQCDAALKDEVGT